MAFIFSNQVTVSLNPTGLQRANASCYELALSVNAEDAVKGIQFDLQYNSQELNFNGATCLLTEFMFDYRDRDNGLIRGLLFSNSGATINPNEIAEVITFDFTPVDGFSGESMVEFTDLILAGEHGIKIPVESNAFTVSAIDIPTETKLNTGYPNPFNPVTTISYDLSQEGPVNISAYDIRGRVVSELVNGTKTAGSYKVIWNGSEIASGTYFIRMTAGSYTDVQKVLLIK